MSHDSLNCNELAKTLQSMTSIMETLQSQNSVLIKKVELLEKQIAEMKEELKTKVTYSNNVQNLSIYGGSVSFFRFDDERRDHLPIEDKQDSPPMSTHMYLK